MKNDHRSLSAILVALLIVGCGGGDKKKGPPPKRNFQIEVEVVDKRDNPVPEAPVLVDGTRVGYTDRKGTLVAKLHERPGRKVTVSIGEMEGYRVLGSGEVTEKLQLRKSVEGKGYQPVGIPLSVQVTSITEPYLIWIRTECDEETLEPSNCRDLSIKRDGEVVTRTDRSGRAHFAIEEKPGTTINLMIDTPDPEEAEGEDDEGPTYEPEQPTYQVELAPEPKVYLIEQSFKDPTEESETNWEPPSNRRRRGTRGGGGGGSGGSSSSSSGSSQGGGGRDQGSSDGEKKPIDLF